MKLRRTHYDQLFGYIIAAEDSGEYYGNKEQFYKRHYELKEWVMDMLEKDTNEVTLRSQG